MRRDRDRRCACVTAQARADIYVDAAAPAAGDGQLATPFRTLHEAYAAVPDNTAQVIRVAAGNYVDNVGNSTDLSGKSRKYTFLGGYQSGSGFATRDPATYVTTATAADATKPVFWFFNASAVTIDGFTITNGQSGAIIGGWASGRTSAVTHCHVFGNGHFSGTYDDGKLSNGGGLSISGLSVTVSDNVIENNNSANFGGGVFVDKLDGDPGSTATVERNAIKSNTAHGGRRTAAASTSASAESSATTSSTATRPTIPRTAGPAAGSSFSARAFR